MELHNGLQLLIFGILSSCVARVFIQSVKPEKIFSNLFYYLEDKYSEYENKLTRNPFWLSPFGFCEICTAFWVGLIISIPLIFITSLSYELAFMPFIVATIIYNKWL